MTPVHFRKAFLRFFSGCVVLAGGILTGYCIGQTGFGRFLPRLLSAGTALSFITAVYFSLYRQVSTKDFIGNSAFLVFCLFLCSAVFGSSISATAAWQLSPYDRIAGFLPYADASDYYKQAIEWPAQTFNAWNSRRPLNAALNIMEFKLGGSTLLGMILIRVALAALTITAFIVALASAVGRPAALASGFILLNWSCLWASSMLSEINGITISAAGFALLIVALTQKRRTPAYFGLFAISLAYVFRPYNPLMPALFAFAVVLLLAANWRKSLKPAFLAAFAFTLLAIVLPKAIYFAYGHPDGITNGNTGFVVLGFARGTDWSEANKFTESKSHGLSERDKDRLMYEMAAKQFIENPKLAFIKVVENSLEAFDCFQDKFAAAFRFPGFSAMIQRKGIWLGFLISSILFMFFPGAGVKKCPWNLRRRERILFMVSFVSFISIAPFIFIDGGWRVVATLYPGLAMLATGIPMGIRFLRTDNRPTDSCQPTPDQGASDNIPLFVNYLPMALIGFVLLAMTYPALSRVFSGEVGSSQNNVFILDVRDGEKTRWTGFNSATVSPQGLLAWAAPRERNGDLPAWVAQNVKLIQHVRYENGVYVFRLLNGDEERRGKDTIYVR